MTDLFWASTIVASVAFGLFALSATYLYLALTRRTLRFGWMRAVTGTRGTVVNSTRSDVFIALGLVVLSQVLASMLVIDGLGDDPFAGLALVAGLIEWGAVAAWVGLLIAASPSADS